MGKLRERHKLQALTQTRKKQIQGWFYTAYMPRRGTNYPSQGALILISSSLLLHYALQLENVTILTPALVTTNDFSM